VAFLLVSAGLAGSGSDASLKSFFDGHRWFELRDAIRGEHASPFYLGAVASAFNDVKDAEKYLNRAAAHASSVDEANDAHGLLSYLYARLGRPRDVVRQFDAMLKLKPGQADVLSFRSLFEPFSRYPNQSIGRNRHASISCRADASALVLPVSANGKTVHWMLDTGANLGVIGESEAKMLGMEIQDSDAQTADSAGGKTAVRAAVIRSLKFGEVELTNVAMLVISDSQPPMNELPLGERGILGLPVAFAFQAFRWSTDGTFEIGSARHPAGVARNLCFDGLNPIARVQAEGKQLDFSLDTGNGNGTQLWERFSNDFATMIKEHGVKGNMRVTEAGGSGSFDVTALPELRLRIGGFETTLRPANVFSKPVGNEYQHGLLGLDLLTQAHSVSVDFRSMSLALE
jgi:hypothetical protein